LVFIDESNKHCLDPVYYIAAILITTRISYLDIFRDITDKRRNRQPKNKELKFSSMNKEDRKNLFYDLAAYRSNISIHIEKGSIERPLRHLTNILNSINKKYYDVTLILDRNFLTNSREEKILKEKGFELIIKGSRTVPGIQVADCVAGAFRLFDNGDMQLLKIILNQICEYSRNNLKYTPSVR